MTSPAKAAPCLPPRAITEARWCVWLSAHLLLYFTLDLGTLAVFAATEGGDGRNLVVDVLVAVTWGMPLHVGALLLAAGTLMFLRALQDLRWFSFRLAALAVFVLPAPLLTLLLTGGDLAALRGVLPMHILMGVLVVQPQPRWANVDPAMDQHHW